MEEAIIILAFMNLVIAWAAYLDISKVRQGYYVEIAVLRGEFATSLDILQKVVAEVSETGTIARAAKMKTDAIMNVLTKKEEGAA